MKRFSVVVLLAAALTACGRQAPPKVVDGEPTTSISDPVKKAQADAAVAELEAQQRRYQEAAAKYGKSSK